MSLQAIMSANGSVVAGNTSASVDQIPADQLPRQPFRIGPHTREFSLDECRDEARRWRCMLCEREEFADKMRIAIMTDETPAVLCCGHAVALHKEAGVNSAQTVFNFIRFTVTSRLEEEDRVAKRQWKQRQEVKAVAHLFKKG